MLKVVVQLFFREQGQELRFGRSVDFTDAVNQFSLTHALLVLCGADFYQLPWEVSAKGVFSLEEQHLRIDLGPISINPIYVRG